MKLVILALLWLLLDDLPVFPVWGTQPPKEGWVTGVHRDLNQFFVGGHHNDDWVKVYNETRFQSWIGDSTTFDAVNKDDYVRVTFFPDYGRIAKHVTVWTNEVTDEAFARIVENWVACLSTSVYEGLPKEIATHVKNLGSRSYWVRYRAMKELRKLPEADRLRAITWGRMHLRDDPEVQHRLDHLIYEIRTKEPRV